MRLRTQRVLPKDIPRLLVDPVADSLLRPGGHTGAGSAMWRNRIALGGVALLGSALGVSQVVHGIYDETVWAPIALGALGLVVALAVTAPRPPPLPLLA